MDYRLIVALTLCTAGPAAAASYTVAPNGNDNNNGTTAPFRTVGRAFSALRDGDTIVIKAGTYGAGLRTSRRNITIRGEGEVILDGGGRAGLHGLTFVSTSGITLENLIFRNWGGRGLFVASSSFLTIRRCGFFRCGQTLNPYGGPPGVLTTNTSDVLVEECEAAYNGSHGIYLSRSGDRLRVLRSKFHHNGSSGLQINATHPDGTANRSDPNWDGISKDCLVEGNTLWENNQTLNLMGVHNSRFVNNLAYNNKRSGISLYDNGMGPSWACKNNKFLHNTFISQPGQARYAIQLVPGSTGNELQNNILICGAGTAIQTSEPVRSNFNCLMGATTTNVGNLARWRQVTGNDMNSHEGNPGLTADFRLAPNSPCIDGGTAGVEQDKDGTLRPQGANPDLGCYELVIEDPAPAAPTGLKALAGNRSVTLQWNKAEGAGIVGYRVYRSLTQTGTYTRLTNLVTLPGYVNSGLTNGRIYWFRVTTVNAHGKESAPSAPVSGTPRAPGRGF